MYCLLQRYPVYYWLVGLQRVAVFNLREKVIELKYFWWKSLIHRQTTRKSHQSRQGTILPRVGRKRRGCPMNPTRRDGPAAGRSPQPTALVAVGPGTGTPRAGPMEPESGSLFGRKRTGRSWPVSSTRYVQCWTASNPTTRLGAESGARSRRVAAWRNAPVDSGGWPGDSGVEALGCSRWFDPSRSDVGKPEKHAAVYICIRWCRSTE